LNLHNLYHKHQSKIKGWPEHSISPSEYQMLFCEAMPFSKEFRYYDNNNKLVGVGYVDVLRTSYSSLYFFYHPEWSSKSPGIFSALTEIKHAMENNTKEYHLGYYVPGCSSMDYKLRFSPYKLLKGDDELWSWDDADWK
ncbi:MAG: arginyl-tRNA--protein transferase, partial [Lentisphaeraceae bacterium]|nr:arginyl-tRNA--protein transferase [Lentisphaeraceae bacterium]